MKKKFIYEYISGTFILLMSFQANAFVCSQNGSSEFNAGTRDIYIDVDPVLEPNQNIIFDSTSQIMCRNESGNGIDWLSVMPGTKLEGRLSSVFNASVVGTGGNYAPTVNYFKLPITSQTVLQGWRGETNNGRGPLTLKIVLSPVGNASGIEIKRGDKIATYNIRKEYAKPGTPPSPMNFTWNVYANNNVIVPVGGCDINTRNISVNMGDYPINTGVRNISLSIKCGKTRSVSFSLNGVTDLPTVFSNTSNNSPSKGIGVEVVRNNTPVTVNTPVAIGNVGTSFQSIPLGVRYAINGQQIKAGNFMSIIGINFSYN
ncbi:fimbrial protein [Enterobacter kobei]|uniref:fimbrial protein n=1 Tax=Enterobacter kobei TaxID=208224 RepID=UPI001259DD55|nr:fimbrial protein [Enterobacter kobei]VAL18817.1 mannose-specific adhesin FimH [Enterobacter kobei]